MKMYMKIHDDTLLRRANHVNASVKTIRLRFLFNLGYGESFDVRQSEKGSGGNVRKRIPMQQ